MAGRDRGLADRLTPAGQPRRVVDLGAGTGKATRTLAGLGHQVVAVDPPTACWRRCAGPWPTCRPRSPPRVEVVASPPRSSPCPIAAPTRCLSPRPGTGSTLRGRAHSAPECCARAAGWGSAGTSGAEDTGPDGWLGARAEIVGNPEEARGPQCRAPPSLRGGLPDAFGPLERRLFAFEHVLRPDEPRPARLVLVVRPDPPASGGGARRRRSARAPGGPADHRVCRPVLVLPRSATATAPDACPDYVAEARHRVGCAAPRHSFRVNRIGATSGHIVDFGLCTGIRHAIGSYHAHRCARRDPSGRDPGVRNPATVAKLLGLGYDVLVESAPGGRPTT